VNFSFRLNSSGLQILLPSMSMGCFMFAEVFWFKFLLRCSWRVLLGCGTSLFQAVFLKQSLKMLQAASTSVPKSHGAS